MGLFWGNKQETEGGIHFLEKEKQKRFLWAWEEFRRSERDTFSRVEGDLESYLKITREREWAARRIEVCLRWKAIESGNRKKEEERSKVRLLSHIFYCHWNLLGWGYYAIIYPLLVLHVKFDIEWTNSSFAVLCVFEWYPWISFPSGFFFPPMHKPVDSHMRKGSVQCFPWFIWCSAFMLAPCCLPSILGGHSYPPRWRV